MRAIFRKPTGFKPFPPGLHPAIVTRAEWRQGGRGTAYLFIVWRGAECSHAESLFFNALTEAGRAYAIQRLGEIASAAGLRRVDTPNDLLGAVAMLLVPRSRKEVSYLSPSPSP